MVRYGLCLLTFLVIATSAQATSQSSPLHAKEIRHRLVGKVISDHAHWHYYLKRDGSIDGEELTRPRKGRWRLEGDRLCITIVDGAAPDECWEVAQQGQHLTFGTYGQVTYFVYVEPPPVRHRASR